MGFENDLIGQSNFTRQPSPRRDIAGGYFFKNRQVLPKRLGKSRPGRLRLRICRQRAGLSKAESWATGEAKGSGFAISRMARAREGSGSPYAFGGLTIRKNRSAGSPLAYPHLQRPARS